MIDTECKAPVTARDIDKALTGWLRRRINRITMSNVFIKGSPWENDVICVKPSMLWTEFEIKVTVADYRNDFTKTTNGFHVDSPKKHELYATKGPIEFQSDGRRVFIPKPKQFYFVVPAGLLEGIEIPPHAGLMEFSPGSGSWGIKTIKVAPTLGHATKLGPKTIFNLAVKAASKVRS